MQDFSNLPTWLPKKIAATGMTVEQFARKVRISRSVMYGYLSDQYRPTEQTMVRMCRELGVPFEQGLSQYTPRKVGPPFGTKRTTGLRVRR